MKFTNKICFLSFYSLPVLPGTDILPRKERRQWRRACLRHRSGVPRCLENSRRRLPHVLPVQPRQTSVHR